MKKNKTKNRLPPFLGLEPWEARQMRLEVETLADWQITMTIDTQRADRADTGV
jgi:hypothetical protein